MLVESAELVIHNMGSKRLCCPGQSQMLWSVFTSSNYPWIWEAFGEQQMFPA